MPVLSDLATRTRLRVELREVEPEDAFDGLLSRHVDLSMVLSGDTHLPGSDDARVVCEHLLDDVMDVALPFDHPMADRPEIDLADLADADWIIATPGVPCHQLTWDACNRSGFAPRARHYADEFIGTRRARRGRARRRTAAPARPAGVHERTHRPSSRRR